MKELKRYNIYSNHFDHVHDLCGIIHVYLKDAIHLHYKIEIIGEGRRDFPVTLYSKWMPWYGDLESQDEIIRWLEDRVVPRNRQGLDEALRENGLDHWDLDELLRLNGGRKAGDQFEVEMEFIGENLQS